MKESCFLSIKEAAEILGMSNDTIKRAIKSNAIKAFQLNNRGTWRIPIQEIRRLNQELVFMCLERDVDGTRA